MFARTAAGTSFKAEESSAEDFSLRDVKQGSQNLWKFTDLPQPADIDRSGSGFMDASGGAYILLATGSYGLRLAFTGSASTHTCTLNWYTV